MSLSIGIIGALAGIGLASTSLLEGLGFLGPILALVFAMVIGLIVAVIAKKIIGMKIPVLEGAAALSVLGFSAALAGTYSINGILDSVIAPGFIVLFFIMNTMAIQHPFNACLGPNENQVRTLKLAASTAFLAMVITGLLAIASPTAWMGIPLWLAITVVGAIGWVVSFRAYVLASFEEAASVKWSGLWPKIEQQ